MMKRIDRIMGSAILAIGLIHTVVGLIPGQLDARAMWFIGTGLAVIYQGAFNLLRVQYGAAAAGLKRISMAANVVGLVFAVWMVLIRGARALEPTTFLFLAILAAATVFSVRSLTSSEIADGGLPVRRDGASSGISGNRAAPPGFEGPR